MQILNNIKLLLNRGFKICCPHCHDTNYDIYPTGYLPDLPEHPVNDIWYKCQVCGTKWRSGFTERMK